MTEVAPFDRDRLGLILLNRGKQRDKSDDGKSYEATGSHKTIHGTQAQQTNDSTSNRAKHDTHKITSTGLTIRTVAIFTLLFNLNISETNCALYNPEGSREAQQSFSCEPIRPILIDSNHKRSPLNLHQCPKVLRLAITDTHGDEIVIDLVKNSRLISDKYFKLFNEVSIDSLGFKINSDPSLIGQEISSKENPNSFYKFHNFLPLHNFEHNNDHCHFQGTLIDNTDSVAAISIVGSKLLSGYFHRDGRSYHLLANATQDTTLLVEVEDNVEFPNNAELARRCFDLPESIVQESHRRSRRAALNSNGSRTTPSEVGRQKRESSPDNKVLHEPYQRNSSSLFVELLVVHDHNQFKEYNGNTTLIAERTMQIVNIMNAFYRQLNIFIALVGVVLWTSEDEIKLTEDGDSTLTNFLKYRYEKLLPRYHHDNAQLITSTSFNGSVVGKALKGPICTHDHSGGVNTDHSHSPAIVAVTLAHELGHNLGMEHDEDNKCSCPDEKCIMSSSSSFVHPKHWSSCSLDYLEDSRRHGLLDCLTNKPEQVFGPVCGDGFVEEGEDCDIGEPMPSYGTSRSKSNSNGRAGSRPSNGLSSWLNNPCCDRATCKFVTNATCAQGPCCDLTRCAVFNTTETRVCRPKKTECDFEETCDGSSEFCPPDVHYHDGVECGPTVTQGGAGEEDSTSATLLTIGSAVYNRSRSYCYQGQCRSHESQCQLLWGASGTTSRDICYEQNVHGNTSGNCG